MEKKYTWIKIIVILLVILICIVLLLYFLINRNSKNIVGDEGNYTPTDTTPVKLVENMKEVDVRSYYYIIKNIVNNYSDYVVQYNTDTYYSRAEGEVEISDEDRQAYLDIIYNLYDKEYMEQNNITKNDLIEDIKQYDDADEIEIKKMYYQDMSEDITIYIVQTTLLNKHKYIDKEVILAIKLDKKNGTFAIIPKNAYDKINLGENIKYSDSSIEKNIYNQYKFQIIDDLQIVEDLSEKYINTMLYNREQAYDLFSEEYRDKRFGSYENFSKFVENNLKEIAGISFEQYLVNTYDGYKEYVCKDQYENLYIFKDTSVMNFKVELDTYTMENSKFTDTYNSSNTEYKVMMNIDKWMQMINCRDYRSAFNVLDETFRTTNFNNDVDKFEEYMRYSFPDHYKVEYGDYSEETGISIKEITLTDITGKNTDTIEENIYMQLKDGTDFVMSFNLI